MRLLFLSRWYPYPANNGSKIRIYNLLKYLGKHHEVYLASFTAEDEPVDTARIAAMQEYCREVHVVTYRNFNPGGTKALAGFLSSKPRSLVDCFSPEMEGVVQRLASRISFDAVIASQIEMPLYTRGMPDTPKILEEAEISVFYDQIARETSPLKRMRKQLMWSKWANYTREVMNEYDMVTVVSQPEVEPLHRVIAGYERIAVIPNGADLEQLTGNFAAPEPKSMVYTGALTYYVNFDAMQFFLSEVYPLILRECPEAKLSMAGRLEGTRVEELPKYPNAVHVGHLSDVRPFVQSGWVGLIPERVGGGTRIKLFESLALGTPIVATRWAAKGVDAQEGREILTGDTPQELADAVLRLFRDPVLRENMSRAGRKLIEDKYDWNVIGQQLEVCIEDAIRHWQKARVR